MKILLLFIIPLFLIDEGKLYYIVKLLYSFLYMYTGQESKRKHYQIDVLNYVISNHTICYYIVFTLRLCVYFM